MPACEPRPRGWPGEFKAHRGLVVNRCDGNGSMTSEPAKRCGCGCGAEVVRRYLPGHDARHKAALVRAANVADRRQADRAINQLLDLGWAGYADLATLRQYVQRDRGKARQHIADVTTWLVGPNGQHHARHACRVLTATAKAAGHKPNAITKLAPQAAITRTTSAPVGWDICQACTTEHTLDELVEWNEVGKQTILAIYDELGLSKLGNKRPSRKERHAKPQASQAPAITLADMQYQPTRHSSDEQPSRHPQRRAR